MKKLLILASAIVALASCSGGEGFVIKGTVPGVNGEATLTYTNAAGETIAQTAAVNDGAFVFKGTTDDAYNAAIAVTPEGGAAITQHFYIENAEITMELDPENTVDYAAYGGLVFFDAKVSGGRNNEFANAMKAASNAVGEKPEYAEMAAAQKAIERMGYADMAAYRAASNEFREKYAELTQPYYTELEAASLECIKSHPECEAAAYMFNAYSSRSSLEELEAGYAALTPEVQNSFLAKELKTEIEGRRATAPGAVAPDFTLKDPEGNDVTLSSLRGQYVLVDFWASWCKPCRAGVPGLKELYAKYHDKGFEILGVSDDSDHDKWKKAIEEDQSPWIHVCDEFPEKNKPARVSSLYATHYIPAYFLLDKDGVIIGQMDHDQLEAKLAEIFD